MNCDPCYLAVIPARAGSKRLPGKNYRVMSGKPLIAWTIESAIAANVDLDIVVTTDDANVKSVIQPYSEHINLIDRPTELASDSASSMDVLFHAIEKATRTGKHYQGVILLQPTSPLRTKEDIEGAFRLFEEKNATSVVSVTECEHSPLWSNTLNENKSMSAFIRDDFIGIRSQDLPSYFRLNGAIYIANMSTIETEKTFFNLPDSYAYIMERSHSIDIDEKLDFEFAEFLFSKRV
ncbi:cytidylyltransferase domain-containing protein [Alteromonas stellipolaris]|uniref:acylneuraminate cytidylyltransferase family protein n=1 Tax=Alteromonas stellipolaris TaxID=233316 RepID=UPI0007B51251|nr:acylneuraminate cytidylyltransferase family protein [Alteromonas stellipolaris]